MQNNCCQNHHADMIYAFPLWDLNLPIFRLHCPKINYTPLLLLPLPYISGTRVRSVVYMMWPKHHLMPLHADLQIQDDCHIWIPFRYWRSFTPQSNQHGRKRSSYGPQWERGQEGLRAILGLPNNPFFTIRIVPARTSFLSDVRDNLLLNITLIVWYWQVLFEYIQLREIQAWSYSRQARSHKVLQISVSTKS